MVYYYNNKIPTIDDIVIAKVEKISELGIEVSLIEYDGKKGFINCSEVSRKKKVNFNKILTVGKDILLNVIQIDETKEFIDLSKRAICDDDIKLFNEKHKSHMYLYNIFKHIFMRLNNIDVLNKIDNDKLHNFMCLTLFDLQTKFENDLLCDNIISKENNTEIIESINYNLLEYSMTDIKKIIDEYIDNKINRIKPELTETIKLITYSSTGLADLKYALDYKSFNEFEILTKDFDISINYITGSIYSLIIKQKDFNLVDPISSIGINDALCLIKKEIKKRAIEKQIQNKIID